MPNKVREELTAAPAPAKVRRWAERPPSWLNVLPTPGGDDAALAALDDGERAAIALAVSLQADLILMDDRAGVAKARGKGFAVTGTLGLLIRAAERNLIDLDAAFHALGDTSFYAEPGLFETLLAAHAGRKSRS